MLVGWWLVFCLVITSAYQSSLVAHLTVQSKMSAINTWEDLVAQDDWTWGSLHLGGTTYLYFNLSTDPVLKNVLSYMQVSFTAL